MNNSAIQTKQAIIVNRGIEQIERQDPTEETLSLPTRWIELVKPGMREAWHIKGSLEKVQSTKTTSCKFQTNKNHAASKAKWQYLSRNGTTTQGVERRHSRKTRTT